jgi:glutaredoxin
MVRISGQKGVPVIVIDGDVMIGFNRRALEEKLR